MSLSLSFSILKPLLVLLTASLLGCINGCVEKERLALLDFKTSFAQSEGKLTSWSSTKEAEDCCTWEGITCDTDTLHVVSLSLWHQGLTSYQLRPSLLQLQYLTSLDLGDNGLAMRIPHFFGSLTSLTDLSIEYAGFFGMIPSQLGNLSRLQSLHIASNMLSIGSFQWLSRLSSLQTLRITSVNFTEARDWLSVITNLPFLTDFECSACFFPIPDMPSTFPSHFNSSSSLQSLVLGDDNTMFASTISASTLSLLMNSTGNNLSRLNLAHLILQGPFPNIFDHMVSMETLSLAGYHLQVGALKSIGNICSLKELDASGCGINRSINDVLQALASCAVDSLETLDLSSNSLTAGTIPSTLKFPSLTTLLLNDNQLDNLSDVFSGMIFLEKLVISGNRLDGGALKSIANLCNLNHLEASECSIGKSIADVLQAWTAGCASDSLETLDLSWNNLTGTIPSMLKFGMLSELHLDHNRLEGFAPHSNPLNASSVFPANLFSLYMSHNTLSGMISDANLTNLPKLMDLDLSNNPNLTISFSELGVSKLLLRSCNLGPNFPNWLLALNNIIELDISQSNIFGSIPIMFWLNFPLSLVVFNLSCNNLHGTIPNLPIQFGSKFNDFTLIIDLSSNAFSGPIPSSFFQADLLDLSKNNFSSFAPIPYPYNLSFLHPARGRHPTANSVDISDNNLSDEIPEWLWSQISWFNTLNLANNKLSGIVQSSKGYPLNLYVLNLRNNSFFGPFPSSLRTCTNLKILDLSLNKFSGLLPSWLGEDFKNLAVLSLQSNNLTGSLPADLCLLSSLQILDLSDNKLLGNIPSCSFPGMAHQVTLSEQILIPSDTNYDVSTIGEAAFYRAFIKWKGMDRLFRKNLVLYTLIDLSKNNFSGEIPTELTSLLQLDSLDLSGNNLHGHIPNRIGQLESLEFLNLSCNKLSGPIPASLSEISSLGMLDLSHNNLSGRIPKGTQLQGFNSSAFADNPDLCGLPLQVKCPGDVDESAEPVQPSGQYGSDEEDNRANKQWFYAGLGTGFAFGLLGILGTLTWITKWRYAFFHFATQLGEWILLAVAMSISKICRKFQFK